MTGKTINRRNFLLSGAAASSLVQGTAKSAPETLSKILTRPIPRTEELLPVIGLGTWRTFDVGNDSSARNPLKFVLHEFVQAGGSVVDSSPMYGSAESVVGHLAEHLHLTSKLFLATKVWTTGQAAGEQQMQESLDRFKTESVDLMQVHNLLDTVTHMETMQRWKQDGKIRYTGLSHYHSGGYAKMSQLMRQFKPDFIQINYSLLSTEAEQEIFPLAQKLGIAVLVNRPYEAGKLFSKVKGKALPEWASEFECNSWGQFFLKFIIAHPAVTCVIPGTSKVKHVQDNLAAGRGLLPSKHHLSMMREYFKR